MSLRVSAASSIADHAFGAAVVLGFILAGDAFDLFSLADEALSLINSLLIVNVVLWVLLASYLWVKQGGRGRLDRRRPGLAPAHGSLSADQWDEALVESETLRRNVAGVALDEETVESAIEESPTFAAEYLEAEARS